MKDVWLKLIDPGEKLFESEGSISHNQGTYVESDWIPSGTKVRIANFPFTGKETLYTPEKRKKALQVSLIHNGGAAFIRGYTKACNKKTFDQPNCKVLVSQYGEIEPSAELTSNNFFTGRYMSKGRSDFQYEKDLNERNSSLFPMGSLVELQNQTPLTQKNLNQPLTFLTQDSKTVDARLKKFNVNCEDNECWTTLHVYKPATPIKRGRRSRHSTRR